MRFYEYVAGCHVKNFISETTISLIQYVSMLISTYQNEKIGIPCNFCLGFPCFIPAIIYEHIARLRFLGQLRNILYVIPWKKYLDRNDIIL